MKLKTICLHTATLLFLSLNLVAAEPIVKNGDKIAFLGDSITQQGVGLPSGYVNLVMKGLAVNDIKAEMIPAGISGHKSDQMLARLEKDVLNKKPQIMTLSCGVNDVWHGAKGIQLPQYKENITKIVEQAQAANIKVVILTSTMIKEDQANPENQKLVEYNNFLREIAKEKGCPLADLNAEMQASIKELASKMPKPANGNYLTSDGVHMGPLGNMMMAEGVLKALGLDQAQLEKAKEAWLETPDLCELVIPVKTKLNIRQYLKYMEMPAADKNALNDSLNKELSKFAESLTKK